MINKSLWVFFLVLAFIGCASLNPIGPLMQIGVYWQQGEAHKYYNTDQETIHQAVRNVLESELGIPILSTERETNYIQLNAGDDDRFRIRIYRVREKVTRLSIRVNIFGDRPYAEMIYRHVDKQSGVVQWSSVEDLNAALSRRR